MTVPGTSIRIPVRKGPAGELLMWAAARWHREVEPLVEGWNWGWAYRAIRGASALSNHASGTAIDLNAPRHPLGVPASRNLSPAQIAAIRRIIADAKGCLEWGGLWSRPDAMHIEVVKPEAECVRVLASLTGLKEDELSAQYEKDDRARWAKADQLEKDLRGDLAKKQKQIDQIMADVAAIKAAVVVKKT